MPRSRVQDSSRIVRGSDADMYHSPTTPGAVAEVVSLFDGRFCEVSFAGVIFRVGYGAP